MPSLIKANLECQRKFRTIHNIKCSFFPLFREAKVVGSRQTHTHLSIAGNLKPRGHVVVKNSTNAHTKLEEMMFVVVQAPL